MTPLKAPLPKSAFIKWALACAQDIEVLKRIHRVAEPLNWGKSLWREGFTYNLLPQTIP